jgi:hypothetical protein
VLSCGSDAWKARKSNLRARHFRLEAILVAAATISPPVISTPSFSSSLSLCVDVDRLSMFPPCRSISTLSFLLCIFYPLDGAAMLASPSIPATRVNKVAPKMNRFCLIVQPLLYYTRSTSSPIDKFDLSVCYYTICYQQSSFSSVFPTVRLAV